MVRILAARAAKISVWAVWNELYQYRLMLWEKACEMDARHFLHENGPVLLIPKSRLLLSGP